MLRLDAINRVLVSAQLVAVSSLSSPDEMVSKAITIFDDVTRKELERGWDFNTDYDYALSPTLSQFPLPTTPWAVLACNIRPSNSGGKDIVVREGKLYDKTNRTFTFTESEIKADLTWDIDFDDLPLVMQEFIISAASVKFSVQVSVDPALTAQLRVEERDAWSRLKQSDSQQSEASVYQRYPLAQIARNWIPLR